MNVFRAIVLPTVVSTPLWTGTLGAIFRGWSAFIDLPSLSASDWIFGLILTVFGLVLIGLPSASFLARRTWPTISKTGLLLVAGAIGGGVIASLYLLLLAGLSGGLSLEDPGNLAGIAALGMPPGIIVALVWLAFNFGSVRDGSAKNA